MAAKPVEEAPAAETLKYQTWVLKVFIHCEGCKKKVKKVLQGIDGVYTTEIDSQQHKVKVTGNVDANTLIKKLVRSGKFAEVLPEQKPHNKDNKSAKSKDGGGGKQKEEIGQKNSAPLGNNDDDQKGSSARDQDSDKEDRIEGDDEAETAAEGGGEGGKKKKKNKKKKNKGHNNINGGDHDEESITEALPATGVKVATPMDSMDLIRPPLQQPYPYPPPPPPQMYYSPPQPQAYQYGLSYNTAYPTSTSSYYTPASLLHANYTTYPRPPPPPPPSLPINLYHDQHEYEGGCSIM